MKKHKIVGFTAMLIILLLNLAGCTSPSSVGVQFFNEAQLKQEGFVTELNQEIDMGDEKVVLQMVAFDRDSMAFAYKGGNVQLIGSAFNVKGLERAKPSKSRQQETSPSLGVTVGSGYHVAVVPHNLKLVNQKVSVELNINGRDNKFILNFPGLIINSSTAEVLADKKGNVVQDAAKATYKVIVGVGYTIVESKDDSDFVVEDKDKNKIKRSYKGSTTGESIAVFDPLPLPRKNPSVKVEPSEKVISVSVE